MTLPYPILSVQRRSRLVGVTGLATTFLLGSCNHGPPPGQVLVTSGFTDEVLVLDAETGNVEKRLKVDPRIDEGDEPHSIVTTPDHQTFYVALAHGSPTLWKYEAATLRLIGRTTLPQTGAGRIGVSHDGSIALIPDYFRGSPGEPSSVSVVDLHSMTVVGSIQTCDAPHDAQISPTGRRSAVTCALGDEILFLDTTTSELDGRLAIGGDGTPARPMNLVWSKDGQRLFVTLMGRGTVAEVDPETGVLRELPVGAGPAQIAISPDGSLLSVANRLDGTVSLIDAIAFRERRRIELPGAHPHGIIFDHKGEGIYVTLEGSVDGPGAVVALDRSGNLRWTTEVGQYNLGVAFLPRDES